MYNPSIDWGYLLCAVLEIVSIEVGCNNGNASHLCLYCAVPDGVAGPLAEIVGTGRELNVGTGRELNVGIVGVLKVGTGRELNVGAGKENEGKVKVGAGKENEGKLNVNVGAAVEGGK